MANSRKNRPTMPPMNKIGHEHRDQRDAHGHHGEADLARAIERGLQRGLAALHVAHDVFQHHDGVVHHEAGGHGERHQRQVVERCSRHRYMMPKVPA